jgi:hypothetical protein
MSIVEFQSQVGPDGMLVVSVPVGSENANRQVKVTVEGVEVASSRPRFAPEEWRKFILETAGSIDDPTFVRPDQGTLEQRDELFP